MSNCSLSEASEEDWLLAFIHIVLFESLKSEFSFPLVVFNLKISCKKSCVNMIQVDSFCNPQLCMSISLKQSRCTKCCKALKVFVSCWTLEEKSGGKRRGSTTSLAANATETAASYCTPVWAYFYFWTGGWDESQFSFECQRDLLKFISQHATEIPPHSFCGG